MREYLFVGCGFAVAAALQPGPLQAFLFSRAARSGWARTMPAAFAPLVSDVPVAALVLLVLVRVPHAVQALLQAAGGILLLYLATAAYRDWRRDADAPQHDEHASAPRTLGQAVAINIFNPNPYLGWSLVLGPLVMRAWRDAPSYAVIFVVAFYGTMVAMLALTVIAFSATRLFSPRVQRALVIASAVLLAMIGIVQLVDSVRRFRG